jgi:putative ABC transport system substrate-binding protein
VTEMSGFDGQAHLDGRLQGTPATGSLMSDGPSLSAIFRRAPAVVDKILKGTPPGDIPVEQPTNYNLVINLRAARALGLTIRRGRSNELVALLASVAARPVAARVAILFVGSVDPNRGSSPATFSARRWRPRLTCPSDLLVQRGRLADPAPLRLSFLRMVAGRVAAVALSCGCARAGCTAVETATGAGPALGGACNTTRLRAHLTPKPRCSGVGL